MLTWLAIVNAEVSYSSRRILIFSGILPAATTPGELAALLGHELAHVLANHSKNTKSTNFVAFLASIPCIPPTLLGLLSFFIMEFVVFLVPISAIVSGLYYVSRKREKEADYIAMMLMADAGFDPSAAVAFWEKMKCVEDSMLESTPGVQRRPQWQSTHPYVSSTSNPSCT